MPKGLVHLAHLAVDELVLREVEDKGRLRDAKAVGSFAKLQDDHSDKKGKGQLTQQTGREER